MSFITKRERVFKEWEPHDLPLPSRNEGKLKTYESCTDARAWSHFNSDKTEHLVEVIKKNNQRCRVKYVPTDVIVDTVMVTKNREIGRLKRRVEDIEKILAVYESLELTNEQKRLIGDAHKVIKITYSDLESMQLDLSQITDVSESYDTGRSSGDTKINNCNHGLDQSTSARDDRIDEMQEALIGKDAKISAMANTIAVMENDVCEPYCLYAHLYTNLEKIFGVLFQNAQYKNYLEQLLSGKSTRDLDIKGKIIFKIKVLEKFCFALISPCVKDSSSPSDKQICVCAEVVQVDTSYAYPSADDRRRERSQLVADILENEDLKVNDSKESILGSAREETLPIFDGLELENYSIQSENLNRLKNLQINYDELVLCYENLKNERDSLQQKCNEYEDAGQELETLKNQLRDYNLLWNEKEHFRKRSIDLDSLKEQYIVLAEETSNLESQLKAVDEINEMKSSTIDNLRRENINFEKKLNDLQIAFDKEKNALQCKLKETECTAMLQEQQIKTLSAQIDRILEQDRQGLNQNGEKTSETIKLMDEMAALEEGMKNLKEALLCSDEEKQQLQEQFQESLQLIKDLKMQIEDWKSVYEKTLQRNEYLENYTDDFRGEVHKLIEENKALAEDVNEKNNAVSNLMNVVQNKSQEISSLLDEKALRKKENDDLLKQLKEVRDIYDENFSQLEQEKQDAVYTLQLAKQDSRELLDKLKEFDDVVQRNTQMSKSIEDYDDLQKKFLVAIHENQKLREDLANMGNNNAILLEEMQLLRFANSTAYESIQSLKNEKEKCIFSLELTKKGSEVLEAKASESEELKKQIMEMKAAQEQMIQDKMRLENELQAKSGELNQAIFSIQLNKKGSEELMSKLQESEKIKEDLNKLDTDYKTAIEEKNQLENENRNQNKNLEVLLKTIKDLQTENGELKRLQKAYDDLLAERDTFQNDLEEKSKQIDHLCNTLDGKIEENRFLSQQIRSLEQFQAEAKALKDDNSKQKINNIELLAKLAQYGNLQNEFNNFKQVNSNLLSDKERLERELEKNRIALQKLQQHNKELNLQINHIFTQNKDLEGALINTRKELIATSSPSNVPFGYSVLKEVEEMKKEKMDNQIKILALRDQLEESKNRIFELQNILAARDERISILENHINELNDEVRRLHNSLAQLADVGEDIKTNSYQKIDESLNLMEAHHSKATHNIKLELATLQNDKLLLEKQLSLSKFKDEETSKEKNKYEGKIKDLQKERETIAKNIQVLEIIAAGDSTLCAESCKHSEILQALNRIRKSVEAMHSKNGNLEQTLMKVQGSSQLLLTKADEAKKLLEKEKQKIYLEKEEAIEEKMNMEKQLHDLRDQLQDQTHNDIKLIKDLEARLLNQKLITNKLNESTQDYIRKLEEELHNIRDLYEKTVNDISQLQEKIRKQTDKNVDIIQMLEKAQEDVKSKSKEIEDLQKIILDYSNKPAKNSEAQTVSTQNKNIRIQTEGGPEDHSFGKHKDKSKSMHNKPPEGHLLKTHKIQHENNINVLSTLIVSDVSHRAPETSQTKNLNDKFKRLSVGRLEQYFVAEEHPKDSGKMNAPKEVRAYHNDVSSSESNFPTSYTVSSESAIPTVGNVSDKDDSFALYSESNQIKSKMLYNEESWARNMQPGIVAFTTGTETAQRVPLNQKKSEPGKEKFSSIKPTQGEAPEKFVEEDSKQNKLSRKSTTEMHASNASHMLKIDKFAIDTDAGGSDLSQYLMITENDIESSTSNDSLNYGAHKKDVNKESLERKISPNMRKDERRPSPPKGDFLGFVTNASKTELSQIKDFFPSKIKKSHSDVIVKHEILSIDTDKRSKSDFSITSQFKNVSNKSTMAQIDNIYYITEIQRLSEASRYAEKDHKIKMDALKMQYDNNIKNIMNDHNEGVKSIQSIHEDTLQDIMRLHENEAENLRTMSIDALRNVELLEKENKLLKAKLQACLGDIDEESPKFENKLKRKCKCRGDTKLTKTSVEAFNVKPKSRCGPCTCTIDVNVSETIRNIFQQMDIEQRTLAENKYLKYISLKIASDGLENLESEEISFLHLKVCKTWKSRLVKAESLKKKMSNIDNDAKNKRRFTQQHLDDLDRRVEAERRRLHAADEALWRVPTSSGINLQSGTTLSPSITEPMILLYGRDDLDMRCSEDELLLNPDSAPQCRKTSRKNEGCGGVVLCHSPTKALRFDCEDKRDRRVPGCDEQPTRLRRHHDRSRSGTSKK